MLWAHFSFGFISVHKGAFIAARDHLERCIELYDRKLAGSYGYVQDPGPTALLALALVVERLGYPDRALQKTVEALEQARELAQPFTSAWVYTYSGEILMRRGDEREASKLWEEAVALCTKYDLNDLLVNTVVRQGWALVERGRVAEGIQLIREGIAKTRVKLDEAFSLGLLALANGRSGQADEGLRLVEETLRHDATAESRLYLTWLYQVNGELQVMRGAATEAERCFRNAIETAQRQEAKTPELAATAQLARLLDRHGRREEARAMLGEIYNWFTEGFDTRDLKDAKALLDELRTAAPRRPPESQT
jgi:tetratricopeptide (TPR) repeat protein